MKLFLTLLLAVCAVFTCRAQDYEKEGALSGNLKLTIAHQPKDGSELEHFQIVLTNVSGKDLDLIVEREQYRGTIVIAQRGQKPVEFYEKDFLRKMNLGTLAASFTKLEKGGIIVWKIPLADLHAVGEHPVKTEALREATVHAVLERVAVVATGKRVLENNARQTSAQISVSR